MQRTEIVSKETTMPEEGNLPRTLIKPDMKSVKKISRSINHFNVQSNTNNKNKGQINRKRTVFKGNEQI